MGVPIVKAAYAGHMKVVQLFLEGGANPFAQGIAYESEMFDGERIPIANALGAAKLAGRYEIVDLLDRHESIAMAIDTVVWSGPGERGFFEVHGNVNPMGGLDERNVLLRDGGEKLILFNLDDFSDPKSMTRIQGPKLDKVHGDNSLNSPVHGFARSSEEVTVYQLSTDGTQRVAFTIPTASLGRVHSIAMSKDLVFLGTWTEIAIFDLKDSNAPRLLEKYAVDRDFIKGRNPGFRGIRVYGPHLYLMIGNAEPNGIEIVDVSEPTDPQRAGYHPTPFDPNSIYISGTSLYVVGWTLHVVDITDTTDPKLVADITSPAGSFSGIFNYGNFLFVTMREMGVMVVKVEDPSITGRFPSIYGGDIFSGVTEAGNSGWKLSGPLGDSHIVKIAEKFD